MGTAYYDFETQNLLDIINQPTSVNHTRELCTRGLYLNIVYYINREEISIDVIRLNKKYKGKYRFKAQAKAPLHQDKDFSNTIAFRSKVNMEDNYFTGNVVYSKTKKGADTSALINLLHQCRPPLSKQEKYYNTHNKDEPFFKEFTRIVTTEVRVSNALDFIMNDSDEPSQFYHEIRK